MIMAMTTNNEMSTGEIARRLEDMVREVRNLSDKMLLREVYEAQRQAFEARLSVIENDRSATRRQIYSLAGTFVVATLIQVLVTLLSR